jgi:hypothetical protein
MVLSVSDYPFLRRPRLTDAGRGARQAERSRPRRCATQTRRHATTRCIQSPGVFQVEVANPSSASQLREYLFRDTTNTGEKSLPIGRGALRELCVTRPGVDHQQVSTSVAQPERLFEVVGTSREVQSRGDSA